MAACEPQSRFATNGDVRLHYIVAGSGEALLFIHGIPDFCSGWRRHIDALSPRYRAAAMDMRGFNRSDKPVAARAYRMAALMNDVTAVMRALGNERVTLIGHDWGAIIGWWVATLYPHMVSRLAVLSSPHPLCYISARVRGELRYSRDYLEQIITADRGAPIEASKLAAWVSDPAAKRELVEALGRSEPEGIRNYYRANLAEGAEPTRRLPQIKASTLIMFGAADHFIPQRYYEESVKYVSGQTKLVSIPNAGHFIHREAAEQVIAELIKWLDGAG